MMKVSEPHTFQFIWDDLENALSSFIYLVQMQCIIWLDKYTA